MCNVNDRADTCSISLRMRSSAISPLRGAIRCICTCMYAQGRSSERQTTILLHVDLLTGYMTKAPNNTADV